MNAQTSTVLYREPAGCLYPAGMTRRRQMTVQEARDNLAERLNRLDSDTEKNPEIEHTVISRRSRTAGVLVDIDWYRRAAEALGDPTEF
jgi:hypothetical protein